MRIALIDTNKKPSVYPVALLKIGGWRKARGDKCHLFANALPKAGEFDAIWLTTTFTYDLKHSLGMAIEAKKRAASVKVGGVAATLIPEPFIKHGVRVHEGLIEEAEKCSPDYSLLPEAPKYSITHTSRGCIRKCDWCMVPTIEGKFANRPGWKRDLHPDAKRIVFYDNNWLAKTVKDLDADVRALRKLVQSKRITGIDFNQGLDPRLVTDKKADLMKDLPLSPIRFAFDGMHEDGFYQDAIRKMFARGHRTFWTLALYNFRDTPSDMYYRMKAGPMLLDELGQTLFRVSTCPMRFHPVKDAHLKRDYVGVHWTKTMIRNMMTIVAAHNPRGAVSCAGGIEGWTAVEEFEFWFGKDSKAFVRLLNYPKLKDLVDRKKVDLRMKRAKIRATGQTTRKAKTK